VALAKKNIETNVQGLAAVVAMTEPMPGFIIAEECLSSHHSAKPPVRCCIAKLRSCILLETLNYKPCQNL